MDPASLVYRIRLPVQAVVSNGANLGMIVRMIEKAKEHWREFSESNPGQRFQERYRRRQQDARGHILKRVSLIVLGAVIALGSLFLAPLPGPGFATVFLGLAILAGELLPAARFLDWAEVKLRKFASFVEDVWKGSLLGKVSIVAVAVLLAAAVAYVIYCLFFAA
jgi:uncharacterized protein (TIGR02611 family)